MLEKQINLYNDDCLNVLKKLPSNSIDLILTDPPYYQVKSDAWDNQWGSVDEFLDWLRTISLEMKRVLKPSGTLFLFCGSKLASDTEILLRESFNVLSHIVWAKPNGPWLRQRKSQLRTFFPSTERIIMCEQLDAEAYARKGSDIEKRTDSIKSSVYAPLIEYFIEAKKRSGLTASAICKAMGTTSASHWFTYSQWSLPSQEQYERLQSLFNDNSLANYGDIVDKKQTLQTEFSLLNKEYQAMRAEYESLRRVFRVSKEVPYIDVWTFRPVPYYPGKHPCEKPQDLLRHIITACSNEGGIVADFFMGSGSTAKACNELNRKFIGTEMDIDIFNKVEAYINK